MRSVVKGVVLVLALLVTSAHAIAQQTAFESVQESISNGILTLDVEGRVVTANRAACALLGSTEGDPLGLEIDDLLGPENAYVVALIQRLLPAFPALTHVSR